MKLIKYTRPKLPRNKYGLLKKDGYFSGSIVSTDGEIELVEPPTNNTNTNITTTTTIYQSEWYNIQNKVVHGKQTIRDANGAIVMQTVVNERNEIVYEDDGVTPKTKPVEVPLHDTWVTVIENYDPTKQLKNTDEYRFVLLRFRKNKREGKQWRIPMLSARFIRTFMPDENGVTHYPKMTWNEQDTWWKVEGAETRWWASSKILDHTEIDTSGNVKEVYRLKRYDDVLPLSTTTIDRNSYKQEQISTGDLVITQYARKKSIFRNSRSSKMIVGVALFKKSKEGATGWQRVSNIAPIKLVLTRGGITVFETNNCF